MFSNYLKVAFRNITRNKVFSLINIMGLALGMAGAILLLLNIRYGLNFDQFHQEKANLYTASIWLCSLFQGTHFSGRLPMEGLLHSSIATVH